MTSCMEQETLGYWKDVAQKEHALRVIAQDERDEARAEVKRLCKELDEAEEASTWREVCS